MYCFNHLCPFRQNTTINCNRCECLACQNRCKEPVTYITSNRTLTADEIARMTNNPAADVAPVVHGVWARVHKIDPISGYRCSKCRRIVGFDLTPYCPNCGAKMDGGDNDAAD